MILTNDTANKIFDAKLTICNYCKLHYPLFDNGKCEKCILHVILKDEKINSQIYDVDVTTENIDNIKHLNPKEDQWWYEDHPLYDKCGIYGIYVDDNLVYVGQSKILYQRWVHHAFNIFGISRENYRQLYVELRKKYKQGATIKFKVLEFCETDMLSEREDFWIYKMNPALNTIVPKNKKYNNGKSHTTKNIRKL